MRRSSRSASIAENAQKEEILRTQVDGGREDGLAVIKSEDKGRGVVALKSFEKGQSVCTYHGQLITVQPNVKRVLPAYNPA